MPDAMEAMGEEEVVVAVAPEESEVLVVRPKERKALSEDHPVQQRGELEKGLTQSTSGNWWHSSAITGPGEARDRTPPPAGPAAFQGWRERWWTEEDNQEWSYSMGPGATTMEGLREHFGEASFRDAPSWQS